jgi:DNA polymerase-1
MVARDRIINMQRASRSESSVIHLTDDASDKGLRYKIATVKAYQGNRAGKSKPRNWPHVREYLLTTPEFGRSVWADREADDGIAQAAYCATEPIVIGSTDKDMRMLPGLHLDWKTGELVEVPHGAYSVIGDNGLQYGLKWFCLQMLQGDAADNCPGLEFVVRGTKRVRCGEKTAEALLDGIETFDEAIAEVAAWYERCYADEWADRFVEQAGLMWLRQTQLAYPDSFMLVLPDPVYGLVYSAAKRLNNRLGFEAL